MSRRTFISKWNPYPKPPPIPARSRGRPRSDEIHSEKRGVVAPAESNDAGGIRWYGDPSQTKAPPRITHGRMTQRVGLFRNAKQSQIVVNEISSVVRKASNKQIGRLVAPEKDVPCSSGYADDPFCDDHHRQYGTAHEAKSGSLNAGARNHGLAEKKRQDEFPYRLRYDSDYGSEGNRRRTVENTKEFRTEILKTREGSVGRPPSATSTWRARVESNGISDFGSHDISLSYEVARRSPTRVKCTNPVSKIAAIQKGSMRTPPRGYSLREKGSLAGSGDRGNRPSMSGVAARVLSALPPIYLRDDHHEKYDTLAVRLLAESIKCRDSTHGSSPNIFRSFLNSTTRIIAEENSTQPDDDGCEDVFQEQALNIGASPAATATTPVLERLFNQTVAGWNGENALDSPSRAAANATHVEKASSMMTPSSVGSNKLEAAPFLFEEDHLWNSTSPTGNLDNFPFSREASPASSCNSDDPVDVSPTSFEWTIPPAKSDIFDVMNAK